MNLPVDADQKQRLVTRFTLKVTLLEDMHAGSGLGAAGVDALVRRDRQGRPVIRWSHLKGLLVQALYDRERALRTREEEIRKQLERLFGAQGGRGRGIVKGLSLRVAKSGADPGLVVGSTARKLGRRVPETETLRKIEFIRAGQVFTGEVRLQSDDPDSAKFVRRLIERTHRIGGKRTRGAGHVHIAIKPEELVHSPEPGEPGKLTTGELRVRIVLQALEPLCLADAAGPGNLIPSRSHFTPAALSGALAYWALEAGRDRLADALLDHSIRCGTALPVGPLPDEGLDPVEVDAVPYPLSYLAQKPPPQEGEMPWWAGDQPAVRQTDTLGQPSAREEGLKRPGAHDYLVTLDGQTWRRYRCPLQPELRNDTGHSQRAGSGHQLYSVEEIPEDTCFVATLHVPGKHWCDLELALEELEKKQLWIQAGRSGTPLRLISYNAVTAGATDAAQNVTDAASDTLRLLVETDLILRRQDLSFCTRLDHEAVAILLGEAGVQARPDDVEQVSEPCEIRGFNFATGLPRLPAVAIRRGSEALLRFSSADEAQECNQALAARCFAGFGERAGEGYGRLRLNFSPTDAGPPTADATATANPAEERLQAIDLMKANEGFPSLKPGRWQALRMAAGKPAAMAEWIAQAKRDIKRRQKGKEIDQSTSSWLAKVEQEEDAELVRTLGLHAAKATRRELTR